MTENIQTKIELEGKYDELIDIITKDESNLDNLDDIIDDFTNILRTVETIDGGTRSTIAESADVGYDAETTATVLGILQRYDLVLLEENTWYPGPALE